MTRRLAVGVHHHAFYRVLFLAELNPVNAWFYRLRDMPRGDNPSRRDECARAIRIDFASGRESITERQ